LRKYWSGLEILIFPRRKAPFLHVCAPVHHSKETRSMNALRLPSAAQLLRAAPSQIAFGFLEKIRRWAGRGFTPPVPETFAMVDGRMVDGRAVGRG
jgi:hypothetical protein